jgi:hypothetical protein
MADAISSLYTANRPCFKDGVPSQLSLYAQLTSIKLPKLVLYINNSQRERRPPDLTNKCAGQLSWIKHYVDNPADSGWLLPP